MSDPGSVFDPEGPKFGIATNQLLASSRHFFGGKEVDVVMDTANPAQGQAQTRTRDIQSKPIIDPDALAPMVLGNHHRVHVLRLCKVLVGTRHVN
jgi:hypothetical protein